MSGVTSQQTLKTNDGTTLVIDSWLESEDTMIQRPGSSSFTGRCPQHGDIETGYIAMLVGWAVSDHATEHHGGLVSVQDLLETGPSIQL